MNQTIHGHKPELVVMLTHHDYTVGNAAEIFEQCRQSKALVMGTGSAEVNPESWTQLKGSNETYI